MLHIMRYPEFLKSNGKIGFIAPSFGCASLEPYHTRFKSALEYFESRGFSTVVGPNVYLEDGFGKSTSPEKCGEEINDFFFNDKSDIIISAGGGETMCEDLSFVDFKSIAKAKPKWFLGYSDNTNLTFTLPTLCDIAAVYGPCASSFGMRPVHPYLNDAFDFICGKKTEFRNYEKWETEGKVCEEMPLATLNATEPFMLSAYCDRVYYHSSLSGNDSLTGSNTGDKSCHAEYICESIDKVNFNFSGRMLGGCLDIMTILCGTKYDKVRDFNYRYADDGVIWFLESCDLNSLSTLRSLWQLSEAGWFEKVKGFLIGRPMHYNENIMGLDCRDVTLQMLKKYNVPIVFDIDLGHLPPQMPMVSGAIGDVKVAGNSISLQYILK